MNLIDGRGERSTVAVVTAAILLLPGWDGMARRAVFLSVPAGGLALGLGLLRLARRPDLAGFAGVALLGLVALVFAGSWYL